MSLTWGEEMLLQWPFTEQTRQKMYIHELVTCTMKIYHRSVIVMVLVTLQSAWTSFLILVVHILKTNTSNRSLCIKIIKVTYLKDCVFPFAAFGQKCHVNSCHHI